MSKNKSKIRHKYLKLKSDKLRLNIFKSNVNIVAQVIDDRKNHTVISENSLKLKGKKRSEKALLVAKALCEKAKKEKIGQVYFDNSNRYKGSVKILIDELRENGVIA